ncbi:MAG: ClpXP protease specificity-enhancing factor [Gammaproteobacteria bacterium]|nr:ClpXP protease specificity-enhancing factor [Gammaproteobacteria bacterium]
MTSNRPYLLRGLYEWLVDNDLTPHLLVATDREDVIVPGQFVQDDRIVLNISPSAVQRLELGNELISFSARFGGKPTSVRVPPSAVLGIYARENGRGMLFRDEEAPTESAGESEGKPDTSPDRPTLKVVK